MGVVTTVLGPVDAASIGPVLAAESLICEPPRPAGNAGLPAADAVFERAPVRMSMLGRLAMGAPNLDDRTLGPIEASIALESLAADGGGTVVVLADGGTEAAPAAELARLSAQSGVTIVRGGDGSGPDDGLIGAVPVGEPDAVGAAAERAARTGLALALRLPEAGDAGQTLGAIASALALVDRSGLARDRVILVGAQRALLGDAPRLGPAPGAVERLLEFGTALCFDELGRIPTVRTEISDHEIAATILHCAELGAADRVLLSCGIRQKHRLTAFGGNGLEFVATQLLPYLGMLGAGEELRAAVGGGNAARLLARASGHGAEGGTT